MFSCNNISSSGRVIHREKKQANDWIFNHHPCWCVKFRLESGGWGRCSPALHLSDTVMYIVLLLLQFGHAALDEAFLQLKSLLQKLVPRRERLTQ